MNTADALQILSHFAEVDQDLPRTVAIESTDQLARHMSRWVDAGLASAFMEKDFDEESPEEIAKAFILYAERKALTMATRPEQSTSPTSNLHDRYELAAWAEFARGGMFGSDVSKAIHFLAKGE